MHFAFHHQWNKVVHYRCFLGRVLCSQNLGNYKNIIWNWPWNLHTSTHSNCALKRLKNVHTHSELSIQFLVSHFASVCQFSFQSILHIQGAVTKDNNMLCVVTTSILIKWPLFSLDERLVFSRITCWSSWIKTLRPDNATNFLDAENSMLYHDSDFYYADLSHTEIDSSKSIKQSIDIKNSTEIRTRSRVHI